MILPCLLPAICLQSPPPRPQLKGMRNGPLRSELNKTYQLGNHLQTLVTVVSRSVLQRVKSFTVTLLTLF